VVKRFGVLYDDPIVELKNLKQIGSVQTYQEAFEALLNRVDLLELVAMSMFMGGLKPDVGTPIRMFQATTLSETYGLARMQEATNTILKPRYNTPLLPTPKQSTTTYVSKAVTTPVKSNSVGQSSGYVTKNGVHKPYRLTQRELEDKRAKGQCFYCDQKHPPNQKDAIQSMVKELMDLGVIRASQSPFSSPIVIVKKKDGTWRMCIDYRHINKSIVKDKFPIPVVEELIDELNGSVVFSKLNLSKNLEEHYDHLAQVLQVMKDNTFYAKRTQCYFAVPQVEYLGHIILAQGLSTDPSKKEGMQKWPIPSTLKQLRGFLGLTGYYRRFIIDYASISQPLVVLTKKDVFKWNPLAELAYYKLKKAMVKALVLALPNFEQEFVVENDASGKGIGAVLCQNGHPIAYWSKTLSANTKPYQPMRKNFWQ
nr:Ty3/gypsy retrotransposon protein [Tanacetum cinerariifolium]